MVDGVRRTKIMATLGPATDREAAISELIAAGVDLFRLNFSHGTHQSHAAAVSRIRAAAEQQGRAVAVLQDLAGPKIRTGTLAGGTPIDLHDGDTFQIVFGDEVGGPGRVSTTFTGLATAVRPGHTLLLDDGHIELRVERVDHGGIATVVVNGGSLDEHKGINVPGVPLPTGSLTSKDIDDLRFGVGLGVDFIGLSFVRGADDLKSAREHLRAAGAPALPLIAKLERPEAISRIDEILEEADAVMVARGDLGLELPLEQVPRVQKDITRRARALGVPVIVATQVLESMRTEPRPTRAEVSDAAYAVDSGVDVIMLAGETAVGRYPAKTVQTLDAIIRDAEALRAMPVERRLSLDRSSVEGSRVLGGHGRAICEAAVTLASRGAVAAIVAITRGGKTARLLSALRPPVPIYAATDQPAISRLLALAWGVVPVLADLAGDVSEAANRIGETLVSRGAVAAGSVVVLVSITPDLARGPSNFLKIQKL
jgi:pyruvate kinase